MTANQTPPSPSSAPVLAFAGRADEVRSALEGMVRSARGMVTFGERLLSLLDGSQDDRMPTRRLDKHHRPE